MYGSTASQARRKRHERKCVRMSRCGPHKSSANDGLAEWSKAVDSSSTIFGCVGSNPTAVMQCIAILSLCKFIKANKHNKNCIFNMGNRARSAFGRIHFRHSLRPGILAMTTYFVRGPDFLPVNVGTHPALNEQRDDTCFLLRHA